MIWKLFLGEAPKREFDADRYLNWRFFWDYSGGNFYENMCHQLAFWYKVLNLRIPGTVSTVGGIYVWKDRREVPDTMNMAMAHGEELLFTWASAFGNNHLGITEDVLGTDGTISRCEGQPMRYTPQKVNRPQGTEMLGASPAEHDQQARDYSHLANFLDCIRPGKTPSCTFELDFRVSIACRMAVESYRRGRILHWNPTQEEIT